MRDTNKGNQEINKKSKLINMASAMGEITLLVPVSYPLDSLKCRMQTGYYKDYKDFFHGLASWEHNKNLYRGGLFLYTGLMIRQPMKMVAFESTPNSFHGSIYASIAGITTGIPLSFIKTNYQTNDKFKLDFELAKKINMFKAWRYEIVKESIGNIAFFSIYGILRKSNDRFGPKYVDSMNFINGTTSSMIATFLAYPVDMMKVRKQTIQKNDNFNQIFNAIGYNFNGGSSDFKIRNFWRGITPIFIRVSLFGGIGMFLYEKIKIKLHNLVK